MMNRPTNRSKYSLHEPRWNTIVALGTFAFSLVLSTAAVAQPGPPDAPPPVFIATVEPVYFEGHAAYWYGSHWYWRDPHGWHWYANEPGFLRDHRAHARPARYHYEHRR
jgi:hypothetical protein